jgi:hypothetical protein
MDHTPRSEAGQAPVQAYRLTLAHLLAWMLLTALLMAVYRESFKLVDIDRADHPLVARTNKLLWIDAAAQVAFAPFEALGLSGLALLAFRRGKSFPVHPGHFLLIILGSFVLSRLLADFGWRRLILPRFDDPDTFDRWINVVMAIIDACDGFPFAVAGAVIAIVLIRHDFPIVWRIPLALGLISMLGMSAVELMSILGYMFFPVSTWTEALAWWTGFAAALALFAAVLADLLGRKSRDLLHYAGMVAILAQGAHALVSPITLRVIFPG